MRSCNESDRSRGDDGDTAAFDARTGGDFRAECCAIADPARHASMPSVIDTRQNREKLILPNIDGSNRAEKNLNAAWGERLNFNRLQNACAWTLARDPAIAPACAAAARAVSCAGPSWTLRSRFFE